MGECLISRRSGGESYKTPTLNESYPQDVSLMESASGSATFIVSISEHGKPSEYTYQWYVNGSAVSGATSSSYTKSGLTSAATYTVYCEVANKAGIVTSRIATLSVTSAKPVYTYSGSASLISDGSYNYRIKFLTSGTLKFTSLGAMANGIDVFLVGGGGGGGSAGSGAGGGGGYTKTLQNQSVTKDTEYTITIGAGGAYNSAFGANGSRGGTTSAFNASAEGGYGGITSGGVDPTGGSGGSGGGAGGSGKGGSDGSSGGNDINTNYNYTVYGGAGQGTTTREFGETDGELYAGGGGGSPYGKGGDGGGGNAKTGGTENTGGGGGGSGGSGGSGIVIIRNARA